MVARELQKCTAAGLRKLMLDPAGWLAGSRNRCPAAGDEPCLKGGCSADRSFLAQTEKIELWETALTIEHSGDQAAVPRLVSALNDRNPERRHAAARALGWIWPVGRRAARALVGTLLDKSQPQPVREEAAESLAYSHYKGAIDPLIAVLSEPDVRIRFWAVFAVGGQRDPVDPRVIRALEGMLADEEVAPGNWWSVGREALAMLASVRE